MQKITVGILMGGMSLEREVSFNSGRTIYDYIDKQKYIAVPIFQHEDGRLYSIPVKFLYRGKTSDFAHRLAAEAQRLYWHNLPDTVDIMYIALHGRFGEDGGVQALLELYHVPYVGSKVTASALGMDKSLQKIFLQNTGIRVPRGITVAPHMHNILTPEYLTTHNLNFPLIVKPVHEGSSFGVYLAHTHDDLLRAVKQASHVDPAYEQSVIVEEKITGMEFSCIVVQDDATREYKALSITEIEHAAREPIFTYEQKYMPGRSIKWTPARCSQQAAQDIIATCIRVMHALNFETLGRIDGFLTAGGEVVIIDPNTLSGMAPSSFAFIQAAQCGMSHAEFIDHLLRTELAKQAHRPRIPVSYHKNFITEYYRTPEKIVVGVLLGGASHEREISLESGRNVYAKLHAENYCPIAIFVNSHNELFVIDHHLLVSNATQTIESQLLATQRISWDILAESVDFVFIALHGGIGENGTVQAALEVLKVPYNGSSALASALCMDKHSAADVLQAYGCAVPQQILVPLATFFGTNTPRLTFDFPVIVKPHNDGCSVGVHKATNFEELAHALGTLKNSNFSHALIEEYISGLELTVGVLGNADHARALTPSAAIALHGILSIEEKFLPGAGENQTPAPLPERALTFVKKEIERAYAALGCTGYARIDCFYQAPHGDTEQRLIILEINTLPGLTPATCIFHQAAEENMTPGDFLKKIIELGLEKHKRPLPPALPAQKEKEATSPL